MKYRGFEVTMEVGTAITGVLITVIFPSGDYCTSDRMFLIDQFIDEYEQIDQNFAYTLRGEIIPTKGFEL